MNNSTNSLDIFEKLFRNTPLEPWWRDIPVPLHAVIIIAVAISAQLIVKLIHSVSAWIVHKNSAKKNPLGFVTGTPKFITLMQLIVSAVTFVIYFLAVGLVLVAVFHFKDTFFKTYLSSAAVVGLALSFGLQGLVQDVVTSLTLILSNTIDVGDIVDLSGTIGRVEQIGLRFTKVINFFNQEIFVPNRNIANVARFPQGGVYAYADVQISRQTDQAKAEKLIREVAKGVWTQFRAIILDEPELGTIDEASPGGWNFLRIQFKVWPGQTLIETAFRSQIVSAMKAFDPNYADWMVQVTYRAISGRRDKDPGGKVLTEKIALPPPSAQ